MINKEQNDLILPFFTLGSLRLRIGWFINLRWFLIFIIFTIIEISNITNYSIGIKQLYILTGILVFLNILYTFFDKYYPFKNFKQEVIFTEIHLLIDLICFSFIIHFIGGIHNPFYLVYIIHIVISGILFQKFIPYFNAFFASFILTVWTFLEYYKVVSTYPLSHVKLQISEIVVVLLSFYFLIFAITYILTDFITRFRKIKKANDEKSVILEKMMVDRDRIFRFTAHELKSPLTTLRSILAVIQMIKDLPHEKERIQDMLDRAEKRNDQVLEMVKDMIEITHLKENKENKTKKSVNWREFIEDKIHAVKVYAETEKIEIKMVDNTKDRCVIMPVDNINKITTNLINNAIRYTSAEGKVIITAFVGSKQFGLSVKDTGIGMSPKDKAKIFEEFFRSAAARKMEKIGTGLGLSLVKEIIDKMDGEITVESEFGKGSNFTVTLPIEK